MSRSPLLSRLVMAGVIAAAAAIPTQAAADIINQPFNSPGRDLPSIDLQTALNADTYLNPAAPQPVQPGNLVTFGDSIMANSTAGDALFSMLSRGIAKQDPRNADIIHAINHNITVHGCAQGSPNIPKEVAKRLNLPLNDYSCPGAVLYTSPSKVPTIADQIQHAIDDGALNDSTREVILQGGYNDIYNNYMRITGGTPGDDEAAQQINQETQKASFARAIDAILGTIKQHAPHARVTLLGYHTITDDTPAGWQCIYHFGDGRGHNNMWNANAAVPLFWDTQGEINTQAWLKEAAQRNNVNFIDQRDFSAGHGECAAPQDRWVAGILIDTTTSEHNLALHLTDEGVFALSENIAHQLHS